MTKYLISKLDKKNPRLTNDGLIEREIWTMKNMHSYVYSRLYSLGVN